MARIKVGYIVGSLATASINRKLAKALVRLAPGDFEMTEIPIRDLPLYSYDYDADFPKVAREFKQAIEAADGLMFVTPEYNRGIPGGLKNAIDWASRPPRRNSLSRKRCAVIGTSPGKIGTAISQRELRATLNAINAPQMLMPEAYIQFTSDLFDNEGNVGDEKTKEFLVKFMKSFAEYLSQGG